jgi:alpha-tubulin suppressor-like RCC1 family protein
MTGDPYDDVFRNGVPVTKEGARALAARSIMVLQSAAEIGSLALPLRSWVALGRALFAYDAADVTTAHDGTTILVSADGRRYRRVLTLDAATSTDIASLLDGSPLPIGAIDLGGPSRVLGSDGLGDTVALDGDGVAALIDDALGGSDWRDGIGAVSLSSRVDYLAANGSAGMIGANGRLVMMADGSIRACGPSAMNGDPAGGVIGTTRQIGVPYGCSVSPGKIYHGSAAAWFIDANGWPWSWGNNTYGVLGHGDTTNRATPKRIEWFVTNTFRVGSIVPVMSGGDGTCAAVYFLEDGGSRRVAACGLHSNGAGGDGTTATGNKTAPVIVGGGSPLTGITYLHASCNPVSVVARDAAGSWYGWGANSSSCLGITGANFTSPQALTAMNGWVKAICTASATIALTAIGGGVRTTGLNTSGALGIGTTSAASGWQIPIGLGSGVVDVGGGQGSAAPMFAITEVTTGDRRLKTWGGNSEGSAGAGTTTVISSPTEPVAPFQGVVVGAVSGGVNIGSGPFASMYVWTADRIWGTGYNGRNNLSIGINGSVSTFTEVLGATGKIRSVVCCGYAQYSGLIVLTEKGCFSGGNHDGGQAGIGPTLTNEAVLQPLWVPGIMGPQGPVGPAGVAGPAVDLSSILPLVNACMRETMDSQFPSVLLDAPRSVAGLNGAAVTDGSIIEVSSATKRVVSATGTLDTVAANTPAFDWSTGRRRLRVEGKSATKYGPNSEALGSANWSRTGCSSGAQVLGPDGGAGLTIIVEDTSTGTHYVSTNGMGEVAAAAGEFWSFQIIAKRQVGSRNIRIQLGGAAFGTVAYMTVDLSTGAITASANAGRSAVVAMSVPGVGACWRIELTGTTTASGVVQRAAYFASGTSVTYAGDGTSSIAVGYANLEKVGRADARPTSYVAIPSTAAVTRIADDPRLSAAAVAQANRTGGATIGLRCIITAADNYARFLGDPTQDAAVMIREGLNDGIGIASAAGSAWIYGGVSLFADFGACGAYSTSAKKISKAGLFPTSSATAFPTLGGLRIFGGYFGGNADGFVDAIIIWPFVGSNTGVQSQARAWA